MRNSTDTESASESSQEGRIDLCPHQGCGHTCCEFAEGNYIVLYPGEVQENLKARRSLAHLEIVDDDSGGHRAICKALDRSTCDGGYKPLDCASYPYFPTIDAQGNISAGLKGAKCPLASNQLHNHEAWVVERWVKLLDSMPILARWLGKVRLHGYNQRRLADRLGSVVYEE